MDFNSLFKGVVRELESRKILYSIAGGLSASLHRSSLRTTDDIDVAVLLSADDSDVGCEIIEGFGLRANRITKAKLEGGPAFETKKESSRSPVQILVGKDPNNPNHPGLDLILDEMPWVRTAIERAQFHKVDFGFGLVPSLTAEDLIIAKLYSVRNRSDRFQDYDDLRNIILNKKELDLAYLASEMKSLKLTLPEAIVSDCPTELQRVSRSLTKAKKAKNRTFPLQ